MNTILVWIIGFIKIVVVLGTLITIHELGHFTVAKLCKVTVNKFSIGFGPKLFSKTSKGTEYTLRLIPFGGFVQMEGEEERSDAEGAFNKKNVWQRIAIVAAGALVNIIFALVVYFFICSASNSYYTTVVTQMDGGALYNSGICVGDKILSIDGKNVSTMREIEEKIVDSKSDDMKFTVERNGEKIDVPVKVPYETRGFFGIAFGQNREVVYVYKGSPADKAGVEVGDVIEAVNGVELSNSEEVSKFIKDIVESDIELEVTRGEEKLVLKGVTGSNTGRYFSLLCEEIHPGFFGGIGYALNETGYYFRATIEGIGQIFTGKTENVEVMGPVGIASEITSTKAWRDFFYLMSAISLSLGIFNLMPIPALDGGRILLLIIEGIRRKPLKESVEQGLILAGFALIIIFAIVVTVGDVIKIF